MDDYRTWSEKEKDLFARDIAKFSFGLHSVDLSGLDAGIDGMGFPRFERGQFDVLREEFGNEQIQKIFDFYCEKAESLNNLEDRVLVHKDIFHSNCLINGNRRLVAVFDFEELMLSCCELEFIKALDRSGDYGDPGTDRGLFDRIIEQYNQISEKEINRDLLNVAYITYNIVGLIFLGENPEIKKKRENGWKKRIQSLKDIFEQEDILEQEYAPVGPEIPSISLDSRKKPDEAQSNEYTITPTEYPIIPINNEIEEEKYIQSEEKVSYGTKVTGRNSHTCGF